MNERKYIKLTTYGRTLYLNVNYVTSVLLDPDFENKTRIHTFGISAYYIVDEPIETVLEKLGCEPYREDGAE